MDHGIVYRSEDSFCGPISMQALLDGGEVLLVFREAKWRGRGTHLDPTTRTSMLRSRDGGLGWFGQETPDPAGGNGTCVARLSDGSLLGNSFHWVCAPIGREEPLAGLPRRRQLPWLGIEAGYGGVYTFRSENDGYTWTPAARVAEPEGWPLVMCHGAACELPDGQLLLPITAYRSTEADAQAHGMVLRSDDGGRTWGRPACITDDAEGVCDFHETRLLLLPDGDLLAMHRTPKGNYFRNTSADGGRTWSDTEDTGIWCGASSPADLRLLADGRVLWTRGYRREPFGVRAYLSEDRGQTFPREVVLRDDGVDADVGYPSTVQRPDGRLLTVYYWHDEDPIRHLQRTLWDAP